MALHPILLRAAIGHLVLFFAIAPLLLSKAEPIAAAHPALKPAKFALSIAIFLGSMAMIVPCLSVAQDVRDGLAWTLALTMTGEMIPIAIQALRRTTSHFNSRTALDASLWQMMMVLIVIATMAMGLIAVVASIFPLVSAGRPLHPLAACAWRMGLWIFMLSAVSGFSMGGRLSHSVGRTDGGAALPITQWSRTHGDLRVSHFVSMHALQALPIIAWMLLRLPLSNLARWVLLGSSTLALAMLAIRTLLFAWAGRPLWPLPLTELR